METAPSPLEKKALELALSGDADWMAVLRRQIPLLSVFDRSVTSAGAWTRFAIHGDCEPAVIPSDAPNYPPAVLVRHRDLPQDGKYLVWAKDGYISALEGFPYGVGIWPSSADLNDTTLYPQPRDVTPNE